MTHRRCGSRFIFLRSRPLSPHGVPLLDFLIMAGTLSVMATKTKVVLVDDLTGDPADSTVKFSLDKTEYEIDPTNDNAAELREAFSRYVNAARKAPGGGRR